ncbi:hypothetical protein BJ508DRAFT_332054 [Ascobolus immersus RN42]|uniref:Disintegrin domain-containing protein n=1 Tax=Ascobolus immersus RN42 TaxID=1160509 RepID=A0A3N4HQE4_ASCIM|nr:hypothetical protein BJ508DRAFT_332054 [Ascobolus immersus RN42]
MDFLQRRLGSFSAEPFIRASINTHIHYYGGSLIRRATCGNGLVEPGEDCDCITSDPDAECDDHLRYGCCDFTTCKFRRFGTECRKNNGNYCDKTEYCTGKNAECPLDEYLPEESYCPPPEGIDAAFAFSFVDLDLNVNVNVNVNLLNLNLFDFLRIDSNGHFNANSNKQQH